MHVAALAIGALLLAGCAAVHPKSAPSKDIVDEISKDLKKVRYIAPALDLCGAFIDSSPLYGELSEPESPVFIDYAELCGPLRPITKELAQQMADLATNPRKYRIDPSSMTPIPSQGAVFFYDKLRKPIMVVGIGGPAPLSFCKPYVVTDYVLQPASFKGAFHSAHPGLFELLRPYIKLEESVALERAKLLNPDKNKR
jgi:hypothetical protein